MSNISHNSGGAEQGLPPQLVVNTADFNDQDLQDFVDISEEIIRSTRERRSQRKRSKSHSNTIVATMTHEGLFESISIDDDQYLEAMEHDTTYDAGKDRANLIRSLENIMQYFDEDVKFRNENSFKSLCVNKSTKGKVATAVASLRQKCGLTASPKGKRKTPAKIVKTTSIQELRKKYESSMEAETTTTTTATPSPKAKDSGAKSPKLKRKTKVKQLALLFNNNMNSMMRKSSLEQQTSTPNCDTLSSPAFSSTLHETKSPKLKPKLATYKTKLPSPKPSPFLKRKPLLKTASNNSLHFSPAENNEELQKSFSKTGLVAENVFSQLSVKDKVLLYNKFIQDMTKENPQFSKHAETLVSNVKKEVQRGEVVFEKQNSVKQLRDSLEAKLSPNKSIVITPHHLKKSSSQNCLDTSCKSNEISYLEADAQDLSQANTLTVVLKSSPEARKCLAQRKKKDVTFSENVTILEQPLKRTQSMIRSAYCVEPLAPPKKIRRFRQERLAPKMVFQNPHLEKLFYHWLKDNNGVAFDIIASNDKTNVIEIVPKNSSDQVLPPQEVQEILEAAVNNLEASTNEAYEVADNKQNGIVIIKHALENENCLEKSVIEIELPIEDEKGDATSIPTEGSDSGLTSTNKATSEDSQTEYNFLDISPSMAKPSRKKKLRRNFPLKNEISVMEKPKVSSTDSDSDYKAKNIKLQSYTLPRTTKPFHYNKEMSSKADKLHSDELNNEKNMAALEEPLLSQVPALSSINTDFTSTGGSSTPAQPKNVQLAKTHVKNVSRSCPSLLETDLDSSFGFLQDKSVSEELSDLVQPKALQEQQNLLMDSFLDQGFINTGSKGTPLRINITTNSAHNADNVIISYKVNAQQQAFALRPACDPFMPTITPPQFEPSSLNESSFCNQTSVRNRSNFNLTIKQQVDASQFWISSGDFTAAVTIHYYEPERLLCLRNIYGQKSFETKTLNFGIDEQQFDLETSEIPDEIIKQVAQNEDSCSQYWFATGGTLIPFRGPHLTAEKIQKFFNYIRDFKEETESLRFGIDSYEFSNMYQQTANGNEIVSSSFKTSDLDQSDLDSEGYGQSPTFHNLGSLEDIWRKLAENENKFSVAEWVKTSQDQDRNICKNLSCACGSNKSCENIMHTVEKVDHGKAKTTAL